MISDTVAFLPRQVFFSHEMIFHQGVPKTMFGIFDVNVIKKKKNKRSRDITKISSESWSSPPKF